jgi:hypothetical protein
MWMGAISLGHLHDQLLHFVEGEVHFPCTAPPGLSPPPCRLSRHCWKTAMKDTATTGVLLACYVVYTVWYDHFV